MAYLNLDDLEIEIAEETIEKLQDLDLDGTYSSDLHHELWNTDYHIIGFVRAERWINKFTNPFQAMKIIQDYENDTFGETHTDCSSPEKVANMLAYIYGEEVLHRSETLQKVWNKRLDKDIIQEIIMDLKNEYEL
jgi:hypothetical protein